MLQHAAPRCATLQHVAARCNTLQHAATRCKTLQRAVTHCNTLQHTATHCNTLQHGKDLGEIHAVLSSFTGRCLLRMERFRLIKDGHLPQERGKETCDF